MIAHTSNLEGNLMSSLTTVGECIIQGCAAAEVKEAIEWQNDTASPACGIHDSSMMSYLFEFNDINILE